MPLTNRSNGVAGGLISASWWNDYFSLFRGTMLDQPVQIDNPLTLKAQALDPGTACAPSIIASAGNLGVGAYTWAYTYVNADGAESLASPTGTATTTTGHTQASVVCAAQTSPSPAASTNIYRSKVGTSSPLFFAGTLSSNGGTFTDNVADTSLTTKQPPTVGTYSGGLRVQDSSGNNNFYVQPNGDVHMVGEIFLAGGSLSRIAQITGTTGSGSAQTVNHNLGATPDVIILQYAGNFGSAPTHPPYWYNAGSTSFTAVADNGYFYTGVAIKF